MRETVRVGFPSPYLVVLSLWPFPSFLTRGCLSCSFCISPFTLHTSQKTRIGLAHLFFTLVPFRLLSPSCFIEDLLIRLVVCAIPIRGLGVAEIKKVVDNGAENPLPPVLACARFPVRKARYKHFDRREDTYQYRGASLSQGLSEAAFLLPEFGW